MQVSVTLPSGTLELAGGYGVSSETSGFSISTEGNHQKSDIIGVAEARQFFRGGSLTSVRFQSRNTFNSLADAEAFILGLPAETIDQEGVTATINTTPLNGMQISGTLSPDATGFYQNKGLSPLGPPGYLRGSLDVLPNAIIQPFEFGGQFYWVIGYNPVGVITDVWEGPKYGSLASLEATPDLVATWTPALGSPTGTPTVTETDFIASTLDLYDVQAIIDASHVGATVDLSCVITGRITNPSP